MPTWFHHIIFSAHWLIALVFGVCLVVALWKERDLGIKATAAMVLVPVILRLLLIK